MSHPIIPMVIDRAQPIAAALGLEVVNAVFQTNQVPPVLRIDIRNLEHDTSLEDCERMSKALEAVLDAENIIPGSYVLELSSPGVSQVLSSDRDFNSFKGFPVVVTTCEPYGGQHEWHGNLVSRDEFTVRINLKGRMVKIPRAIVTSVRLTSA
ncbi:MAG: ribosome maturation factor RimP [Cyanobacteria bacterium]|nr:ribosome maturation factor RimP [Cyanobacteriota bacterium]MDW8201436.1 ribosome maturation factor RimP [Cyanobacteriota bacterium SKYGB_h_bin112]